jgi:hypothetical protein
MGLFASLAAAQQPAPLQLNVPYHCTDGITVVVVTCDTSNGPEVCFVNTSRNGQNFRMSYLGRGEPAGIAAKCTGSAAAGAPDLSIAKASAGHVDTKVLGIPLGEPLQVKKCPGMFSNETAGLICVHDNGAFDEYLKNHARGSEYRITLNMSREACPSWRGPSWAPDCTVDLFTYDGLVVAANIPTSGHTVDAAVAKDLRAKYGPPTSVKPIAVTPRVGNPFKAADLEWLLPGLHVVYDVAQKGESDGEIRDTEHGSILIETEAAYQRRLAKEKAKPKPTL